MSWMFLAAYAESPECEDQVTFGLPPGVSESVPPDARLPVRITAGCGAWGSTVVSVHKVDGEGVEEEVHAVEVSLESYEVFTVLTPTLDPETEYTLSVDRSPDPPVTFTTGTADAVGMGEGSPSAELTAVDAYEEDGTYYVVATVEVTAVADPDGLSVIEVSNKGGEGVRGLPGRATEPLILYPPGLERTDLSEVCFTITQTDSTEVSRTGEVCGTPTVVVDPARTCGCSTPGSYSGAGGFLGLLLIGLSRRQT